jgi:hypothetical protein
MPRPAPLTSHPRAADPVAVRSRIPLLSLAALLGAYLVWSGLGPASGRRGAPLPGEPVMVVVVKSHGDVAAVREVIDPGRIVASSPAGFVVREGRVVVASVEAAGPLLNDAGWSEAELEIVKLEARPVLRGAAGTGSGGDGLAALYAKPTLTLDEALLALRLLE